ncbi:lambda family phage tail tape measure protein [Variovorax boronicumulans]|uniref:phage tail tape measure C-terminal domain-containing protein n=1 Tax=Variovorax boronicumulans TaxID=436515 RepID=UPI0027819B1F|nr:phage tail tape measure C-terminal domain-containing protein [Variovorax boronicumulans]MDQ0035933.1 lambda family phage tail tape measure protein [Variovorax boronicumulans]
MTIGSIVVDLLARTGSFETDMNRSAKLAEKRAKEIDAAVTKAGAAIGVALGLVAVTTAGVVSKNIEAIASYKDLSDKIGDSAEQIATLQSILILSGTSADTFAAASIKLTASLAKTDDESKAVGTALADIGLEFEAFKKLSPVEQMDAVAKALDNFADGAGKTAIAVSLFGKSGAELLPFLHDLAETGERQVRLTAEQIAAADDYTKATARLRGEFDAFLQQQTAGIIPALMQVQELLADLAKNQATVETVTDVLNGTIKAATVVFQTLAVVASDVGFVFLGVGREVAAIIAQLDALVRMDFSGFTAISEAVKADGKRARAELDAFQAKVMGVGKDVAGADPSGLGGMLNLAGQLAGIKPILTVTAPPTGGKGKKDNSAAQEAKAQLALDLEDIKKSTAALSNAYDNRDKILSAQRSASLIGEADYFEERRKLQIEGDRLEQEGLQKSINRLQQEQGSLSGKDAIDNQRKLRDAIADLDKARANSAANLKVLDIQAADSATKIARSFADARDAAQAFLDVTNKARELEVTGMGQGGKSRDLASALNQIEQTYDQKRQDLERDNRNGKFAGRQADYERELVLIQEFQKKSIDSYKDYYAQIELRQKSFTLGASEAARNYFDESQNVFKQTEEAVGSAFKGMEDALVNFVKTGKLDFKSLVDSIIGDIARIVIKQQITGPLAGLLSQALGGGGGYSATDQAGLDGLFAGLLSGTRAAGGPVGGGQTYLVGERGPELFTPNTTGKIIPNHELASGAGGGTTNNYFTVGDVASMAEVKKVVAASQAQAAGRLGRSRTYGGAFS